MRTKEIYKALFTDGGLNLLREYFLFKLGHGKIKARALNTAIDYRCNLNCEICYYCKYLNFEESKGHNCRILLSVKEWRNIILKLKKEGAESITLTGAETLLRPEVVDMAYEIFGKSCIIITNGTQPIDQKWRTRVFVSIQSATPALNDEICGVTGTFEAVKKNIANDDRVVISLVLNHKNIKDIGPMTKLAKALNVRGIIFSGYTSGQTKEGEKEELDPLSLTDDDLRFVVPELMKVWEENKDFVFMSPEIIKLFWTKKHQKVCPLRDGWVLSLNSAGEPINQCVMGEGAICESRVNGGCQCIIPKQMYATTMAILRAIAEFSFNPIIDNMRAIGVFTYEPRK